MAGSTRSSPSIGAFVRLRAQMPKRPNSHTQIEARSNRSPRARLRRRLVSCASGAPALAAAAMWLCPPPRWKGLRRQIEATEATAHGLRGTSRPLAATQLSRSAWRCAAQGNGNTGDILQWSRRQLNVMIRGHAHSDSRLRVRPVGVCPWRDHSFDYAHRLVTWRRQTGLKGGNTLPDRAGIHVLML